jgi:FkbM family methyltransferase
MIKQAVKNTTLGSRAYFPLRDVYQYVWNHRYWDYRRHMRAFYAQFVSRGGLVFDVGANRGEYSEIFLRCGGRVVAIEPDPACASILRMLAKNNSLTVEQVAAGNSESRAPFFLCDDSDTHSTLSDEWLEVAKHVQRLSWKRWSRTIVVQVITLDRLILKYGVPEFIKIDVEGYEREVLRGLCKAPRSLSFEFIGAFVDAAIECLRLDCFSDRSRFNMIVNYPERGMLRPPSFELMSWVDAKRMTAILKERQSALFNTYGDIFVRTDT